MITDVDNAALGQEGSIFLSSTNAVSAPTGYIIIGIHVMEDTQFRVLTSAPGHNHSVSEGAGKKEADTDSGLVFTHPNGIKLGKWSTVQLHSGVVELYLGKELKQ